MTATPSETGYAVVAVDGAERGTLPWRSPRTRHSGADCPFVSRT